MNGIALTSKSTPVLSTEGSSRTLGLYMEPESGILHCAILPRLPASFQKGHAAQHGDQMLTCVTALRLF